MTKENSREMIIRDTLDRMDEICSRRWYWSQTHGIMTAE